MKETPENTQTILEAVWESMYENTVRPEKVVVLSSYFLRHLRQLGPELGWMYVAFRQAAYMAGIKKGYKATRINSKLIVSLCGIGQRAFWYRISKAETWEKLAGLVEVVDEDAKWDKESKTPKRLANKYVVSMTIPLTSDDASSLRHWLLENLEANGGPEGVLMVASRAPLTVLLDNPTEERIPAQSVHKLVRETFARQLPDTQLGELAERLHQHIQPPQSQLMLTVFFLEKILPLMGEGPAWLLTILRDKCWVDKTSGTIRSDVLVGDGYAEMAEWMGQTRARTIYDWLKSPMLQPFIQERRDSSHYVDMNADMWHSSRKFDVLLDEIPQELMYSDVTPEIEGLCRVGVALVPENIMSQVALSQGDLVTQIAQSQQAKQEGNCRGLHKSMPQIAQVAASLCTIKALKALKALLKPLPKTQNAEPAQSENSALGANAPVGFFENKNQEQNPAAQGAVAEPQTEEPKNEPAQEPVAINDASNAIAIQAFPMDVRDALEEFITQHPLPVPTRPAAGEKGGEYATWIKGLREFSKLAAFYKLTTREALDITHKHWNNSPHKVSRPQSLVNTMKSALSRYQAAKNSVAAVTPTVAPQIAQQEDGTERRQQLSAQLGFDIAGDLTPEQESALSAALGIRTPARNKKR